MADGQGTVLPGLVPLGFRYEQGTWHLAQRRDHRFARRFEPDIGWQRAVKGTHLLDEPFRRDLGPVRPGRQAAAEQQQSQKHGKPAPGSNGSWSRHHGPPPGETSCSRHLPGKNTPQHLLLQCVQLADLLGPDGRVHRLQHQGDLLETVVVHDVAEGFPAELALAKAFVAVHPAAQVRLGIVQVHAAQVAEADDLIELGKGRFTGLAGAQVVAGGEGVAGIDADAHPGLVLHSFDDGRQVLEAVTDVAALPGGVLDDRGDTLGPFQRPVDGVGHPAQARLLGDLLQVAAGVEVEQLQPQLLAALHLVEKGRPRFLQPRLLGMPQVDEITVVGQHVTGCNAHRLQVFAKGGDAVLGKRPGLPLALVLGEEGEGPRADLPGIEGRVLHAPCCAHVRSHSFHGDFSSV